MAKPRVFGMLVGALLLASTAANATTFVLDNVTFDTDGTITGSFAFDGTNVTNVSLVSSSMTNPQLDAHFMSGLFNSAKTLFSFTFTDTINLGLLVSPPVSDTASNPLLVGSGLQVLPQGLGSF